MEINKWYKDNFEDKLSGRYINLSHLKKLLQYYKKAFEISVIGRSELGEDILMVKIGTGKKRILAWSQMHGNETTTTKALFDFFKFISQKEIYKKEIKEFLETNTFYVIPILNPDGARGYTRENANMIDLNRDAQLLSQKESRALVKVFETIKPHLCLNLHGQRSIFGLDTGLPASISFLSPASNKERDVTSSRKKAMRLIVKMTNCLQTYIPGQIGRYDDSYNENCFGDAFQIKGVPVILFEAGHTHPDYRRENTREFVFYSFLTLFDILNSSKIKINHKRYFDIPENKKNYKDVILRNVKNSKTNNVHSIAIQFKEKLENGKIIFVPIIDEIGNLSSYFGHKEVDVKNDEILVNSQNFTKKNDIIFKIVNKSDKNLVYFNIKDFLF